MSSTLGNCDDIKVTTDIARSFISKFGPTYLSVSQGSATYFDSAKDIPQAVHDLAAELKQEPLTILAIGALTNIALLIRHFPEQAKTLRRWYALQAGEAPSSILLLESVSQGRFVI